MTRSCTGCRVAVGSSVQPLVRQAGYASVFKSSSAVWPRAERPFRVGAPRAPFPGRPSLLDLVRSTDRARGPAGSAAGPMLPSAQCGSPRPRTGRQPSLRLGRRPQSQVPGDLLT